MSMCCMVASDSVYSGNSFPCKSATHDCVSDCVWLLVSRGCFVLAYAFGCFLWLLPQSLAGLALLPPPPPTPLPPQPYSLPHTEVRARPVEMSVPPLPLSPPSHPSLDLGFLCLCSAFVFLFCFFSPPLYALCWCCMN